MSTFVILGMSILPEMQPLLFTVFRCVYLVPVLGNGLFVATIALSTAQHTPKYLLLQTLALVNIVCTSSIVPKLLETTLGPRKTIMYGGCMAQLSFFICSLGTKMVLFTRHGLRRLSPMPVSVRANEAMIFVADISLAMGDFLPTFFFNSFIIAAILRIRMSGGKRKTSTCSSHLFLVSLYFSPVIYTYIRPASSYTFDRDKVVAVTPTLNPIVYSLHNREIQAGT
ncbi:olfactory receptor 13G1-like [Tachyglossus aculeatus]|uniref:olfactory receptor 13G1-like n=1 Tax=Tachyglossus aculeatus TaxID=9261 RepID=UPI0018F7B0D1|nr:olfactory receptor 13G1-like [Tachyglossus aculeatus]